MNVTRGEVKRSTQTRTRIKRALTELIHEKGFDALTVSDITRRAGINRGTFYLHFVDKYDLLAQLEKDLISKLAEKLVHRDTASATSCDMFPYPLILSALKLVADDFDFVAAIAGKGGDPEFHSMLKGVIEHLLDQGLKMSGRTFCCERFPLEYARELATSQILAIIKLWLERDGAEAVEEVARMITDVKDVCPNQLIR